MIFDPRANGSGWRNLLGRIAVAAGILLLGATGAIGQEGGGRLEPSFVPAALHAFTLEHQSAADAVAIVHPLLTRSGTVELQPGGNTLIIRDSRSAIERIVPLLRSFDRPARRLRIQVQIVTAGAGPEGAHPPPDLPPEVLGRLRSLLRYRTYSRLASAELEVSEGLETTYEVGSGYSVDFKLAKLDASGRISLEGFRILRQGASGLSPLIHTNLNLSLGRPMVLGLARTESSDHALMVVLNCRPALSPTNEIRQARRQD